MYFTQFKEGGGVERGMGEEIQGESQNQGQLEVLDENII